MKLTDAQENLRCADFDLVYVSTDKKERWCRNNRGFNFVDFYKNPDESEWRVIITDSCTEREILYIHERLEELNESCKTVYVNRLNYVNDNDHQFYLVQLSCYCSFVIRYPEIPTELEKCPFCNRPRDWGKYRNLDWWKEDNDERS